MNGSSCLRGQKLSPCPHILSHILKSVAFSNEPVRVQQRHLLCEADCFKSPCAVFCYLVFQELQSKSKVCANVFCGAGRECAVNEKGEPSCLCIEVRVLHLSSEQVICKEVN